MIDLKIFREDPDIIKASEKKRGNDPKRVDEVVKLDKEWRQLIRNAGKLRNKRNIVSEEINKLKKAGKSATTKIKEMRKVAKEIEQLDKKIKATLEKRDKLRFSIGNVLHESVPIGKDEADNVEIKKVGKAPKFAFKPKSHVEIAENLGIMDLERAAKVAGHGFYYLKGDLAILDHAIQRYALDLLCKRGYVIVEPPFMLRRKPYEGVTDLADFEDVMYKIDGEDLYLIATSEHPMAAMHMNETFKEKDLPVKLAGISPCFRKEVGAHGKYTKGLFRVHQFNKIEQFIFCKPKESWKFHEELQKNAEDLYKGLGIPFRVVNVCTGDIGSLAAKKYDIEILMADGKYRESGSNSNVTAYQATRLNVKYVNKKGEKEYVHTLNNTALATSRTMIAILENFQQKDGSVKIPKVLWKYTGFKVIRPKKQ